MFAPTRDEARRFLIDTWAKYRAGQPLSPLEQTMAGLIALHPEYHALFEAPERHVERDYAPEDGAVNPFLHLSLHLAVAEGHPRRIRAYPERARRRARGAARGRGMPG